MFLEGKNPYTIAGASVLLAASIIKDEKNPLTAEMIAEAAQMAPGTIRSAKKDLKPHLMQILPKEYQVH
jgi:transcription initiation factor TFIIIB Brf1 subunit/transcription initiation factor TFIIB